MNQEKVECLLCHRFFKSISNTHLKKDHNLSCKEYLEKFPNSPLKSDSCKHSNGNSLRGKTYESAYGVEKAEMLKMVRSKNTLEQLKNPEQIEIRRWKPVANRNKETWYKNMCAAMQRPEVKQKRREAIIKKYGGYNFGYNTGARSSKAAETYIRFFLKERDISETKCYFMNGGRDLKEFHSYLKPQKKFVQYDLVVYNSKNEIDIILEYNGPFHFTFEEYITNPNHKPCRWYGEQTVKEIYEKEVLKLEHAKKISNKVFVFWQKYNKLVEYKSIEDLKLKNILNDGN